MNWEKIWAYFWLMASVGAIGLGIYDGDLFLKPITLVSCLYIGYISIVKIKKL